MKYVAPKAENVTRTEASREGDHWTFPQWTVLDITTCKIGVRYIVVMVTAKGCYVKRIQTETSLTPRMWKIEDLAPESVHIVTRKEAA